MKIVLASGNKGKLAELKILLADLAIELVSQAELKIPNVPETGLSFVENAILKARNACQHSGLPALADDSGLEVDALQGAPGIYSARYAGEFATDHDNIEKLLTNLNGVPEAERTARFQCVLVFMQHANDPTPLICQGTWSGRILLAAQGEQGFGYDPVFYVSSEHGSAAELRVEVKSKISHRARAIEKFINSYNRLK